jgi:hypothetical protein
VQVCERACRVGVSRQRFCDISSLAGRRVDGLWLILLIRWPDSEAELDRRSRCLAADIEIPFAHERLPPEDQDGERWPDLDLLEGVNSPPSLR